MCSELQTLGMHAPYLPRPSSSSRGPGGRGSVGGTPDETELLWLMKLYTNSRRISFGGHCLGFLLGRREHLSHINNADLILDPFRVSILPVVPVFAFILLCDLLLMVDSGRCSDWMNVGRDRGTPFWGQGQGDSGLSPWCLLSGMSYGKPAETLLDVKNQETIFSLHFLVHLGENL